MASLQDPEPCRCHRSAGAGPDGHVFGEELTCTKRLEPEPGAQRCGWSWFDHQQKPKPCRFPYYSRKNKLDLDDDVEDPYCEPAGSETIR